MKMYLELPDGRKVPTGETYDSLQDSKTDYPWSVFDVSVSHGELIAVVIKTNENRRKERVNHGQYY